jgi:hypothetical protein
MRNKVNCVLYSQVMCAKEPTTSHVALEMDLAKGGMASANCIPPSTHPRAHARACMRTPVASPVALQRGGHDAVCKRSEAVHAQGSAHHPWPALVEHQVGLAGTGVAELWTKADTNDAGGTAGV